MREPHDGASPPPAPPGGVPGGPGAGACPTAAGGCAAERRRRLVPVCARRLRALGLPEGRLDRTLAAWSGGCRPARRRGLQLGGRHGPFRLQPCRDRSRSEWTGNAFSLDQLAYFVFLRTLRKAPCPPHAACWRNPFFSGFWLFFFFSSSWEFVTGSLHRVHCAQHGGLRFHKEHKAPTPAPGGVVLYQRYTWEWHSVHAVLICFNLPLSQKCVLLFFVPPYWTCFGPGQWVKAALRVAGPPQGMWMAGSSLWKA